MRKLFIATVAFLSVSTAIAQTNTTTVKTGKNQKQTSNRPTVEVRAERSAQHLKTDLALTEDQYTKVYNLKLKTYKGIEDIKANMQGEAKKAERKAAFVKLHGEYRSELKSTLTADQFTKWEALVKVKQDRMKKGWEQQPNSKPADTEGQLMQIELD